MTRDAQKQSVKCGGHNWIVAGFSTLKPDGQITCSVCNHFPTNKELPRVEAILRLKEWIKPGDTLYTQLKSVSRSGMSRVIQVVKIDCRPETDVDGKASKEPDILYLGYNVAIATDSKYDREREGVKIGGCGMDMGFALVYDLARVLFGNGFECIGEGCPSNDHRNGDRDYTPHQHTDGGYSIKQRWL